MEAPPASTLLTRYARLFDEAGLPYMVVGAFAVFVHGAPRFSSDLDIAINLPFDRRREIMSLLTEWGCGPCEEKVDPQWGQRLICQTPHAIMLEVFFVDNVVANREFARAVEKTIEGFPVRLISREDLVLRKLAKTRIRRGVDFGDALGVLVRNWKDFDRDYVKEHCARYRVCGLFDQALEEARSLAEETSGG